MPVQTPKTPRQSRFRPRRAQRTVGEMGARRQSSLAAAPRRRKPTLVGRRVALLILLALGLVLLTLSYGSNADSGPLHTVQVRTMEVVAPIETGLTRAWTPFNDAYEWVHRLVKATSENPRLKSKLDEQQLQLAELQTTKRENVRLRRLLGLDRRGTFPHGFDRVFATVIARSPTELDRSILVDVGSADGVQVDDPVMSSRGLIGRVQDVSEHGARVGLIINQGEAVSVRTAESDASGVLRSVTNDAQPVMEVEYVPQRLRVRVGETVITSGWAKGELESIYPAGIPIGTVTSVGNSQGDFYKSVQVTPLADFDRLIEVVVLTKHQSVVKRSGAR